MVNLKLTADSVRDRKRRYSAITTLFSVIIAAAFLSSTANKIADAVVFQNESDADHDLLPDAFEDIFGTDRNDEDSDDDGFIDGAEYVLGSNPLDVLDVPSLVPSMRVAAYEDGNSIKLCLIFLPGNVGLVSSFTFNIAYGYTSSSPSTTGRTVDLSKYISSAVTDYSSKDVSIQPTNSQSTARSILMTSYIITLPTMLIKDLAPVSIGIGASMVDNSLTDVLDFDLIDNIIVQKIAANPKLNSSTCVDFYFTPLTKLVPLCWSDQEICKTEMEVISTFDGITTYEITDAACENVIKQLCSPSDCENLVGSEIISIDPGYIRSKLE